MRNYLIISILLLIGTINLFSETYIIRDINYEIDGSTRESVLSHYLDIKSGTIFNNKEELNEYISNINQKILNQRTLLNGIAVATFVDDDTTTKVFVDLDITVKDSWNYIILPYPQYDSNTGLTLGFRAKNYNFLGRMKTLSLSFDYLNLADGGTEYTIGSRLGIPFYIGNLEWNYIISEDITLSPEAPFKNATNTDLSVKIPIKSLTWIASANQSYFLNQNGEEDNDGYYLKTSGSFGTIISIGEISYTPAIITSYPYKLSGDLSPDRKGYKLGAKHSISYGEINWFGNFKNGFKIVFDQDLQYNFTRKLWVNTQRIEFKYHKAFGNIGLSTRLLGFYDYNRFEGDNSIGSEIRGIRNDRLSGDSALLFNFDIPITFPLGPLNRWFDAQISPFFDYAIIKPIGGSFEITKGWYGSGLEGFAYLNASKSVYLRMSLGLDMEAIFEGKTFQENASRDDSGIWEFKAVVGHHY